MKINFWLNGAKKEAEISPDIMLLEFLRSLGCYSVKRGCETAPDIFGAGPLDQ